MVVGAKDYLQVAGGVGEGLVQLLVDVLSVDLVVGSLESHGSATGQRQTCEARQARSVKRCKRCKRIGKLAKDQLLRVHLLG